MTRTTPSSDTYALKSAKVTDIPYKHPVPHRRRPHTGDAVASGLSQAILARIARRGGVRRQSAIAQIPKHRRAVKNLRPKQELRIFSGHLV